MSDKIPVLVVCPGRGTYNATELGYIAQHHAARQADYLSSVDQLRDRQHQERVTALDGRTKYAPTLHTRGDNASLLIHAAAYCDFQCIDRERYEIVAITGNSLGWYISLGCGAALDEAEAALLVNTMGTLMQQTLNGAQLVYPLVDSNWLPVPGRREVIEAIMADIALRAGRAIHVSIELGGMLVVGGDDVSIRELAAALPEVDGRFPLKLRNHAAFHTPLQSEVARTAQSQLRNLRFTRPEVPLIDGHARVWYPWSTDVSALWQYTLGPQLVEPYDFTGAVQTAVKEFAPARIIVLGPGNSLGGAVAQALVDIEWQGMVDRTSFAQRQEREPFVFSMGLAEQRALVTG